MTKKTILVLITALMVNVIAMAQVMKTVPTMYPATGTYDDKVTITCDFPEGSTGVYWVNGGELKANVYTGPIDLDYSCDLSVAGVNNEGRIITDVVTNTYTINRVTAPSYSCEPKEGIRKSSFYVTKLKWDHVTRTDLDLSEFKEGKSRYKEKVVWLTNERNITLAYSDYNGIWMDGLNQFKAYLYKDYNIQTPGKYTLHIAKGIFILDGKVYEDEIQLQYEVPKELNMPEFDPEEGSYKGSVTVTINYPTDGSAYYPFYKLNGAKAKAYTAPLVITETSTIEAYGLSEDFSEQTETAKATYTILPKDKEKDVLARPVIKRNGNTISISGPQGAWLKYWMNNDMNTAKFYTEPFEVTENGRVSCVAYSETGLSPTVNLDIKDFPVDRGELGDEVIHTKDILETAHLYALSGNGRFAVGYTGSDVTSRGFIWDLTSDKMIYQSSTFVNQLWGISNDGTAYGWRLTTTELDSEVEEDQFLWGTCKDGVWTPQPEEMTVNGISASGLLFGAVKGRPATYDNATGLYTYYKGTGAITTVSEDADVMGGYVMENGKVVPAVWTSTENVITYHDLTIKREVKVTDLSANGEWAILGQEYRANVKTGVVTRIISMSDRYHNDVNPEVLTTITDDGTIFGTYDGSLMSGEKGNAMVYTTDGRWRSFVDWLRDEKDFTNYGNYVLTSIRGVNADQSVFLLHAFPRSSSIDDAFTMGLVLRINVKVKHLAPVALKAEQMNGVEVIKLSWEAPRTDADKVKEYIVRKNGIKIATVDNSTLVYYDEDTEVNTTYTYTVSAVYNDEVESDESYGATVRYTLEKYRPVHNLQLRRSGLSDVTLTWDAPVVSLPKLQYFNEESEWQAFGTGFRSSEWGIRIPATDLLTYEGQKIHTFQFLPTGPQKGYTINLYRGTEGDKYEEEPYYSQQIDATDLNYGNVNVVELTTPQDLPVGKDLYVALYIESGGTDNMLGVSGDNFKSGYTDLCRVEGIFNTMIPISQNSSSTTEIVIPIGVGVSTEDAYFGNIISNYEVKDNNESLGNTTSNKMKIERVAEGLHEYSVTAIYRDGTLSDEVKISHNLVNNPEAYVGVKNVEVTVADDKTATLKWETPLDNDEQLVHYGDMNPSPGLAIPAALTQYMAASAYSVDMLAPFANDYEITHLYFYPTAEAQFELSLTDGAAEEFVNITPDEIKLNEFNYIELEKPITIDPSVNYQFSVIVYDMLPNTAPLAFDSSNKWVNGMSNLFNYGLGLTTLAEIVQVGEHPNWLMGLSIRQKDAKEMPVMGYNVMVDGNKVNTKTVTDKEFVTSVLADGEHKAQVNVIYTDAITTEGAEKAFTVGQGNGIKDITANDGSDVMYDLQGRRVISDKAGNGIYVIYGKKVIKK